MFICTIGRKFLDKSTSEGCAEPCKVIADGVPIEARRAGKTCEQECGVEFGVVGWVHLEGNGIFTRFPCDVRVKMRTQL